MRKKTAILILATVITVAALIYQTQIVNMFGYSIATLSKYGSSGDEVSKIQSRLSAWGYYTGDIDGLYGYLTYSAVKSFQTKNGLTVDGIAGPETLAALGLPAGVTQPSQGAPSADSGDVQLLARLIHGEARGEPYEGKVAVGAVVLNRTGDSRFPKTIAGVIYQPGAFDAVYDGQINLSPDASSLNAARDAMNGWDPSYGCIYYYNPNTATSSWIWSRPIVVVIGNHNFAR
ncbi:MAG: spore cortex-lytic enzyme [Clostridiaceae bacterium]